MKNARFLEKVVEDPEIFGYGDENDEGAKLTGSNTGVLVLCSPCL